MGRGLRPNILDEEAINHDEKQQGFTLIELVAVIVILGALAVVALPRFIDLQDEAEQASVEGVAGGVSSGFAVNYAGSLAADSPSDYVTVDSTAAIDMSVVNSVMQTGLTDYEVAGNCGSGDWTGAGAGATNSGCYVQQTGTSVSAPFTAIATSG